MQDFDQLFEQTALTFYRDYEKAANKQAFLKQKLPLKYGLAEGILINKQKAISATNWVLYDALTCPDLTIKTNEQVRLFPNNYVYGSLAFIDEINHKSIEKYLNNNEQFLKLYGGQNVDNQIDTKPLMIWLAQDLASFLSLNDLEDRLLAEAHLPDLVAILNRGLLITLNEHTIQQIYALAQRKNTQAFDREITANLMDITQKTMTNQYFKMGASANYKNCFSFYIFLINLLNQQALLKDDLSAEVVGLW